MIKMKKNEKNERYSFHFFDFWKKWKKWKILKKWINEKNEKNEQSDDIFEKQEWYIYDLFMGVRTKSMGFSQMERVLGWKGWGLEL